MATALNPPRGAASTLNIEVWNAARNIPRMTLDEGQRRKVAEWIEQGLKLSEIQDKLAADLNVRMTYMEVRFLIDDLKLRPKDILPIATLAIGGEKQAAPTNFAGRLPRNPTGSERQSVGDSGSNRARRCAREREGRFHRWPECRVVSRSNRPAGTGADGAGLSSAAGRHRRVPAPVAGRVSAHRNVNMVEVIALR